MLPELKWTPESVVSDLLALMSQQVYEFIYLIIFATHCII